MGLKCPFCLFLLTNNEFPVSGECSSTRLGTSIRVINDLVGTSLSHPASRYSEYMYIAFNLSRCALFHPLIPPLFSPFTSFRTLKRQLPIPPLSLHTVPSQLFHRVFVSHNASEHMDTSCPVEIILFRDPLEHCNILIKGPNNAWQE